jgi:hypothetical protein
MITIYKDIFSKDPYYITVDEALARIKNGKSKELVDGIRNQIDKSRASKLKNSLPAICFSGKFADRKDDKIITHSGHIVLDFDNVKDIDEKAAMLVMHDFIYAFWISPSGNGIKALVKIAEPKEHRAHFQALMDIFPEIDRSGINESRVCFESYDPNMYVNENPTVFKKKKEQVVQIKTVSSNESFTNILKWLSNRGDSFATGERNRFIFLLASACSRFGIEEEEAYYCISNQFTFSNDFTLNEARNSIKSAYRSSQFGTARFERETLIDKNSNSEVVIDPSIYDMEVRPKDVVYGDDVESDAISIFENGYERLNGIGVDEIDDRWKFKRGEMTVLTGIGNYGKSTFLKWYMITRAVMFDEKFGLFAPEDNPSHEFYHECTEILMGTQCTPSNANRPKLESFRQAYQFISDHFFFISPTKSAPSPEYIKERFLELIVKENISGCIIDPFNQMANDYNKFGGRSDKYLEFTLSDIHKFSRDNNVFLMIIAHPHKMFKDQTGNYPCPDVYELNDGSMWSNKCDNIIVFHRTEFQTKPDGNECEFHSKKIRRQRTVGKRGMSLMQYSRERRRFMFNGRDPLNERLVEKKMDFGYIYNYNHREIEDKWYNKD